MHGQTTLKNVLIYMTRVGRKVTAAHYLYSYK